MCVCVCVRAQVECNPEAGGSLSVQQDTTLQELRRMLREVAWGTRVPAQYVFVDDFEEVISSQVSSAPVI